MRKQVRESGLDESFQRCPHGSSRPRPGRPYRGIRLQARDVGQGLAKLALNTCRVRRGIVALAPATHTRASIFRCLCTACVGSLTRPGCPGGLHRRPADQTVHLHPIDRSDHLPPDLGGAEGTLGDRGDPEESQRGSQGDRGDPGGGLGCETQEEG